MHRLIPLAFAAMFAFTACTSTEDVKLDEAENVEPAPPEPEVQVNPERAASPPSADIYFAIDEVCGTSLGKGATVSGDGAESTVNAVFIGMESQDREKLECVLRESESKMTWADLEDGIDVSSPVVWISKTGVWAGAGNVSPLGDDAMLSVNFFYLESDS